MHYLNLNPIKPLEVKPIGLEERDEIVELLDDMIDNCDYLKDSERQQIQNFVDNYRKLEHHRDSTVGLLATDKPELAKDEAFFEITY